MGTAVGTGRPTTTMRPGWRSMDCSPVVLSSLNTSAEYISATSFGERQGLEHRLRLVFGLLKLARRIGVAADPTPGLPHPAVALHQGAADRDRCVEPRRPPADVAPRPGVGAAPLRLELV